MRRPRIYLFDEPLSNLDARLRLQMRSEILRLQRRLGVTAVYVTHDQEEAMTMSDKMVVMHDGVIAQRGSPDEVYAAPADLFVAGFVGSPQMNLVGGNVNRGVFESAWGRVTVDGVADRGAVLGVRPELVSVAPDDSDACAARVELAENLCPRAILTIGNSRGDRLTAVVETAELPSAREDDGVDVSFSRLPAGFARLRPHERAKALDHVSGVADELLVIAQGAAEAAGRLLLRRQGMVTSEQKSSVSDLVSQADRGAEEVVRRHVLQHRPHDSIVAEEGKAVVGTTHVRWLVDPLDGTTNYLRGYPGWCVSIAAELNGLTVAAVVHEPATGRTFRAAQSGAFLDDARIEVSGQTDLGRALVGTGFSYDADHRRKQALGLVRLLPVVADLRRSGSAALDLCYIACGALDAFVEDDLEVWDTASGSQIVRQAGGRVRLVGTGARTGVIAATPGLLIPILDITMDGQSPWSSDAAPAVTP